MTDQIGKLISEAIAHDEAATKEPWHSEGEDRWNNVARGNIEAAWKEEGGYEQIGEIQYHHDRLAIVWWRNNCAELARECARLRARDVTLHEKAARFDLDQAGIERREAEVDELAVLRVWRSLMRNSTISLAQSRVKDLEAERDEILSLARSCEHEAKSPVTAFSDALGALEIVVRGECEARARVIALEAAQKTRPMSEAPRNGASIRAWDPGRPGWVDIKWESDGWIATEDAGYSMAAHVHPTCWREEFPPDPEAKSDV